MKKLINGNCNRANISIDKTTAYVISWVRYDSVHRKSVRNKMENMTKDIIHFLGVVAMKEKLVEPNINIQHAKHVEGAMGTIYFASIEDKNGGKKLKICIKKSPTDPLPLTSDLIQKIYNNEYLFYEKLFPLFEHRQHKVFTPVPKCYFTSRTALGVDKIFLEDLNSKGFKTLEKNKFFDKNHMELIMQEYGRFHAMSFVLKSHMPDAFNKLSKCFSNVFIGMDEVDIFTGSLRLIFKQCYEFFGHDLNEKLKEKLQSYVKDGVGIYFKCQEYSGKHSVFVHGDCWTGNFMFKYHVSTLVLHK